MNLGTRKALLSAGAAMITLAVAASLGATRLDGAPPTSLLMLPIVGAAYFGRMIPGIIAAMTAALATLGFLVDPLDPLPWLPPATLLVVGTVMSVAIEALHRSRSQIDAEKRAALESNTRFSRLFHASPAAMCLSRIDDGSVAEINAAYSNLFSLSAAQVVGRTPQQAGLVFDDVQRDVLFARMRDKGWIRDVEISVETRRGRRHIAVSSEVIDLAGANYSLATFIDLTDRRRAELDAQESQERFRELADNVQEAVWVSNPRGTEMQYINPAYERVFCRSAAALERDPLDWMNVVHSDDRARVAALMTRVLDDRAEMQFRIVLPDRTMRTLRARFFPIRDTAGNVVRIAGMTDDITKRLELEEQVRQAQKLESLGLLAGGVAHDFNNILAVIGSSVSMLEEAVGPDDKEIVEEVEKAVTRGASLTRQLLAFSRRQVIDPKILDVNRIVEDTRKMLRRMVGEDIRSRARSTQSFVR